MLPPVDASQLPAEIRDASRDAQRAYLAALGFEQILVRQLAQTMLESVDSDESNATASVYRQMLPDALAEGIAAGGGIGLAPELYKSIAQHQGLAPGEVQDLAADELQDG